MSAEQIIILEAPRSPRRNRVHIPKIPAAPAESLALTTAITPAQLGKQVLEPAFRSGSHRRQGVATVVRSVTMYSGVGILAVTAGTLVTIAATRF